MNVLLAVDVEEFGARPDDEHLPDLLLERHLFKRLLRPFLSRLVEMDRAGLLKGRLRGGECRQRKAEANWQQNE